MLRTLLVSITVTLGLASTALACSCATTPFVPTKYTSIFVGRATESRPVEPVEGSDLWDRTARVDVTFDVLAAWQGAAPDSMTVQTAVDEGMCGYSFQLGETYLVTAHERRGTLTVDLCGHTAHFDDASDEFLILGLPSYSQPGIRFPEVDWTLIREQLAALPQRQQTLKRIAHFGLRARGLVDDVVDIIRSADGEALGLAMYAGMRIAPEDETLIETVATRIKTSSPDELASIIPAFAFPRSAEPDTTSDGRVYDPPVLTEHPRLAALLPTLDEMLDGPHPEIRALAVAWIGTNPVALDGTVVDPVKQSETIKRALTDEDAWVRSTAWDNLRPAMIRAPVWRDGEIRSYAEAAIVDPEHGEWVSSFVVRAVEAEGPEFIDHVAILEVGIRGTPDERLLSLKSIAHLTRYHPVPPEVLCRLCERLMESLGREETPALRRFECRWLEGIECCEEWLDR